MENHRWILEQKEGGELWTDAFGKRFGERVCVGFENGQCIHDGQRFTPTNKECEQLIVDELHAEWGTADMNKIMEMEGFTPEFLESCKEVQE